MNAAVALGAVVRRPRPAPPRARLLATSMLASLALVGAAAIGTIAVRLLPTDRPVATDRPVVERVPEPAAPPVLLSLAIDGGTLLADGFGRIGDWLARQDYREALRSLDRPPPVVAAIPEAPPPIIPQIPARSPPRPAVKRSATAPGRPTHPHRTHEHERQVETRDLSRPAPVPPAPLPSEQPPVQRRPVGDTVARSSAVAAAIARGELGRADRLAREGLALAPDDPLTWLAAANVARARDDKRVALRDLERALQLRLRQLGLAENGGGRAAGVSLHWGEPPDYRPVVIHVGWIELAQTGVGPNRLDVPPDLSPPTPPTISTGDPLVPHPLLDTEPTALPAPTPVNPAPVNLAPVNSPPVNAPPPSNPLPATADPLAARIGRDIAVVRDEASPSVQAGAGYRNRSGASKIDTLTESTVPLEATVSPGGRGTLKFVATPTFLFAGRVDAGNRQYFGTQSLPLGPPGQGVADQHAEGLGLDLGYTLDGLSGDVGATPLGFRETNVVGGLQWAPTIADRTRLRLIAGRRAVTDSLLSYAGTHDNGVGRDWGGVTDSRGDVTLETSLGAVDLYAGGGYGVLDGHHVKSNAEGEAAAGGSVAVFKTATEEARLGLDLVYYGYDRNLRYFTYGQGGYFSPQRYVAALLPLTYTARLDDDLNYELGATVGLQSYSESRSTYFPLDPALQAASGAAYPGRHVFGFAGGAHASLDYRVTPSLHVGAKTSYSHAGDYDEGSALLYARYVFNGLAAR